MVELRILGSPSLVGPDGHEARSVLQQPKRLGLLTYLALTSYGSFQRRDRILGVFWPDSPEDKARASLATALVRLRDALGERIILKRGKGEIGLDPHALSCDAVEFLQAVDAEDWSRAVDAYGGSLLDGFFLDGCPEFDSWLEHTRAHLKRTAVGALGRLTEQAMAAGDDSARALAERAYEIDPLDGGAVRRLMQVLARAGQRDAALAVYETYATTVREERGIEPSRETAVLVQRIRKGQLEPRPSARPQVDAPGTSPTGVDPQPSLPPSEAVSRLNTALEGRYRIERQLGEGGMATVYLADDLKHHRKVALKVLRPELAAVVGAERFLAEIETTAKLQHPHILPLHDSGEADGSPFFVMPLVEGESLRERLDRERQLPVEEAVEIASKVAAALDYAHRHGVIHRDIKPANILLHDGEPVVSDFGIALAVSAGGGDRITETGLSLGTPHYMSPEQATGDLRLSPATDIWALGCVLHEMLAGKPPYTGGTPLSILGKIITADPPSASAERTSVPANVEAAISRALEKVPADRFTNAQAFAKALGDRGFRHGTDADVRPGRDSRALTRWKRVAAVAVAIAAALTLSQLSRLTIQSSAEPPAQRHRVVLGSGIEAIPRIVSDRVALAPDGSGILFGDTAGMGDPGTSGTVFYQGPRSYWWKPLDQADAVRLPHLDNATSPAFSPDGRWVAYSVRGQIRKQPLRGGASVLLVDSAGGFEPVFTWLADGTLLVSKGGVLERVSEDGETRGVVSGSERMIERMTDFRHASGLLGGGGALVSSCSSGRCQLFLVDVERDTVEALANDVLRAWHVPGERVVYVDGLGGVFAARLDVDGLQLGPPVPLFDGVAVQGLQGTEAEMEVGRDGTLLYLAGEETSPGFLPVWVDRDGSSRPIDPDWIVYGDLPDTSLELSPDDARLALEDRAVLWIKELDTGPRSRLTDLGRRPSWSPDGEFLTFLGGGIRRARSDGTGEIDSVLALAGTDPGRPGNPLEALFSPDGEWLIYRWGSPTNNANPDIFALQVGADTLGRPVVATEHVEWNPSLSPDGRWLAYTSDETGEHEVYVRPFPDVESGRWQVSIAGGFNPVWSSSGDELFYRNGENELVSVELMTDSTFATGERNILFGLDSYLMAPGHPVYDVTSDGRRFVMLKAAATSRGETANGGSLVLVQNFFEELKRLVPN